MKKHGTIFAVISLLLFCSSAPVANAHCGECGMEGSHGKGKEATDKAASFEGKIQMLKEKTAVFNEASMALKVSHPELSAKLDHYAKKSEEHAAQKQEWKEKHAQWAKEHKEGASSEAGAEAKKHEGSHY